MISLELHYLYSQLLKYKSPIDRVVKYEDHICIHFQHGNWCVLNKILEY